MNICRNSLTPRLRRETDLRKGATLTRRVEAQARRLVCAALGQFARIPAEKEWIQFQFYHWVLDDQLATFRRQLAFLRRHGDFIGLDDALAALRSRSGIGGRYFCLTFDDGFKNWFTNVVPILKELEIPAAFFIPTKYIGLDLDQDWEQIAPFYERSWSGYYGAFEFLTWDECRQIAAAGFTIGSHTHSHQRLTNLLPDEARNELLLSKQIIEAQLSHPCRHFCCPWGKVNRDFDPALHPQMARRLGYDSFLTAEEGLSIPGDSAFYIRRTGCEPEFHPAMLRYSLFSPSGLRRDRSLDTETQPTSHQNRQPGPAPTNGEPRIAVSEAEPVTLGKFPYPFQAAFTVASDIDSASPARFRAVHALFCGEGVIRPDTPDGRTLGIGSDSKWLNPELGGVRALGLDLADSFFLVGDTTTFGMYRHLPGENRFKFDQQEVQNCSDCIRLWIKEGRIDSFHAFLHHTRKQLVPLLEEFYQWCEEERVAKPSVWINHSLPVTPTGLCPNRLQPNTAWRLIRLTGRKIIGPLLGRQPLPLHNAFARYQGDTPGSPHYVNDLLAANGVRYVWLNMDDLHRNRIALPEHSLNGRATILQPVTMDDGVRYHRFERCYGKPGGRFGGEAYLRDSANGFDASLLINDSNLEALCRSGGTCILYVHWTHPRSFPISDATISRFELLRRWRDTGRIWVTSTSKLLEWTRRRTFLRVLCQREGKRLIIELDGVDDPIFGRETVDLADLNGLCLHLPTIQSEVTVAVNGHALNANQVQRSGNVCWLDASGNSKPAPRPPQTGDLQLDEQKSAG